MLRRHTLGKSGNSQISNRGRLVLGQEQEEQIEWHSTAPNFAISGTNSLPWLLHNKSEVGTLVGTKFFMFIGRWLAVDFCPTKAVYDHYKSMDKTN